MLNLQEGDNDFENLSKTVLRLAPEVDCLLVKSVSL